jgi:predicted double-glycine peptidase
VLATALCAVAVAGASGLWLDVPYIHQEKDGCGSAALAMVLLYWQGKDLVIAADRAEPAKIQRELYEPKLHGITAARMELYLSDSGLQTFAFRGEWSDLRANIAKGRPLIAGLKPRAAPAHYVVITGMAPDNGAVLVNDPERGKLIRMERDQFEKAWKGTQNWTLLATPR